MTSEEAIVAEMRNDPGICLAGLKITTENVTQYRQCPGKDSNRISPEEKCGALSLDKHV
jgi:hypothetical protein